MSDKGADSSPSFPRNLHKRETRVMDGERGSAKIKKVKTARPGNYRKKD
jgi:hypothetical protein